MNARFQGRREDARLLTGHGRYTADWDLPGQLHAAFVRSDRAHAEIVSLDTAPALGEPGVVAVLSAADTAHFASPGTLVSYPGRDGQAIRVPHRNVLARERVRYVGEEVALVVAESAAAALDAAERVAIEYRDLPAVTTPETALAEGAAQIHPGIPANVCFDFEYGDEAKTGEAFARAVHVTRLGVGSQRVSGNPMEPKACLARYDPAGDAYEVWASSQGITLMKAGFAGFGIAPDKVRFTVHDVGGAFGIRAGVYTEYVALMAAAKRTGRPVKWVASRSENFLSDYHGRGIRLSGELALDGEGRFIAVRYRWICDMGAYLSVAGPLINTVTPKLAATGAYRIPAVHARHLLVMTNATPISPYRGAGRPDHAYLIERLVEQAAHETGIDRLELRRRNFIPGDAFPYRTPTGVPYDSGDYAALLQEALERSEWNTFEERRATAGARGRLRGIGCAVFVEPAGWGGPPKDQVLLRFGSPGGLEIVSVTGPSGQGHETVLPEIVARELGIDPRQVMLRASDPDAPQLLGGGTVASRSMGAHGGASVLAAREMIRKGMELAARELEVALQDLEFQAGCYRVKGTDRSIALLELARRCARPGEAHPLDSVGDNPVAGTFPSGAHVAEVEIDPQTGATELARYTAVDDCGTVINPTLLAGQMHGGIAQGAGQVFGEECVYDPGSGQLLSGSFMDYFMPRADWLGELDVHERPVPSLNNPLGVKGAGEAGTTGSLPALMNALLDALRPAGVDSLDMPATSSRVWRAIRDACARRKSA